MPKYIDVDNYCKNICKCNADSCDKEKCPLWAAPACDVVEVVRCKDCKHMSRLINMVHCDAWERFNGMGEDGFCSYGERKE